MKYGNRSFQSTTVWLLLFFMTLLMCFPFLFYYRISALGGDVLKYDRMRISSYGSELRTYFESIPLDNLSREAVISELSKAPLAPDLCVKIYDTDGNLVSERSSLPLETEEINTRVYGTIKKGLDSLRGFFIKQEARDSAEIRKRLLQKALEGKHGVDYIFRSGDLGDRILYFSWPLRIFTGKGAVTAGILFIEYTDTTARTILQKQRNQFALMCLIFVILLICYLLFILNVMVFPLRRLLRKVVAVKNRTEYLLPADRQSAGNNEISEMCRTLEQLSGILESRERDTEEYITELRHIIRNPLAVIKVSLEGLMMDKDSQRDQEFSNIIQKNLQRIDNYIGSYKPVSELVDDNTLITDIDINRFIKELVSIYTPLAAKKRLHFNFCETDRSIIWRGFYSHLFYSCEQLISNAIDFSPENGVITIEGHHDDDKISITISDQGPGIPAGKEQDIFKQYASFRNASNNMHTGTGLYLTMNVLRKIGGSISAGNSETGGAVFKIILPLSV